MARFFKTSRPEFVENFLYQPPWELAEKVLAKKEADIQSQLDTMELVRNLPIDYHEVDVENAKNIKDSFNTRIDDLTSEMQKDLLNPSNKMNLKNLAREINTRYEFGDISKIQKNANAFKDWDANLQKLNPNDREVYKKAMLDSYRQSSPQGALSSIFTPDEMYNSRNLLNEFAEYSSKNIKDDAISRAFDKVNGQWVVSTKAMESGITRDKIQNAFKGWVNSQSDLPGYMKNKEKYFGESYFDDKGQLAFDKEGTTINNLLRATSSLETRKAAEESSIKDNPYAMLDKQQSFQRELKGIDFNNAVRLKDLDHRQNMELQNAKSNASSSSKNNKSSDFGMSGFRVHSGLIKTNNAAIDKKSELASQVLKSLGLQNMPKGVTEDQLFKKVLDANTANKNKFPNLSNTIKALQKEQTKVVAASWAPYQAAFSKETVESLKKDVEVGPLASTRFYLGFSDGNTISKDKMSLQSLSKANPNSTFKVVPGKTLPINMGTDRMIDDYITYSLGRYDKDDNGEEVFKGETMIYVPMSEISTNFTEQSFRGKTDKTVARLDK